MKINQEIHSFEIQDKANVPLGTIKTPNTFPTQTEATTTWCRRPARAQQRSANLCSNTGNLEEGNSGRGRGKNCSLQPWYTTSCTQVSGMQVVQVSTKVNKHRLSRKWGNIVMQRKVCLRKTAVCSLGFTC